MVYRAPHPLSDQQQGTLRSAAGTAIQGIVSFVLIVLMIGAAMLYLFGTVVPPGYFGVRQITFGPGQGYHEHGLAPGLHWTIPLYSKIYLVPETAQTLHFHRDKIQYPDSAGSLEVQAADGAVVDVDLSIISRFFPEPQTSGENPHGGPVDLITKVGLDPATWRNNIRRVADDELRRAIGKLATGEFYNPKLREAQIEAALTAIRRRVGPYGVGVDAILLRRYTYRASAIDDAIFSKNLQDQEERYNVMAGKLAEVQAELRQVEAEGDAKIKTLSVEGENKAKVVRSEADLYQQQKMAEGDLLVAQAVAEVDRLKAGVLAKSNGAANYIARELTPLLGSLKGGIVRNANPYDLEAWMKRLGIASELQSKLPDQLVVDIPGGAAQ